jgi:glycosyltransferase involved in cell wall biosynthesis
MLRCTYIVLIHNNESNIPNLIASLKQVEGNLRKEFIFIDDGSTDNSLSVLKLAVNDLPRTTIITQQNQGPSISINKASSLATGDYIHFVEGNEVLHPDSTLLLIESSLTLGTQVAVGRISSEIMAEKINIVPMLIETPIKEILTNKVPSMREIGKSGSLVHRVLLDKVDKADSSIYTQNMSLSLRCAKYSKFVYINADISSSSTLCDDQTSSFVSYNNLRAIYNFVKENPELFINLTSELLLSLRQETSKRSDKINYSIKSITSKYIKSTSLDTILKSYKKELDRLF